MGDVPDGTYWPAGSAEAHSIPPEDRVPLPSRVVAEAWGKEGAAAVGNDADDSASAAGRSKTAGGTSGRSQTAGSAAGRRKVALAGRLLAALACVLALLVLQPFIPVSGVLKMRGRFVVKEGQEMPLVLHDVEWPLKAVVCSLSPEGGFDFL